MIYNAINKQLGKYIIFFIIVIFPSCIGHRQIFLCNDDKEGNIMIDMINYDGVKKIDTLKQCDCKRMAVKAIGYIIFKVEETPYKTQWLETAKIYSDKDTIHINEVNDLFVLDNYPKKEKKRLMKKCNLEKGSNTYIFLK